MATEPNSLPDCEGDALTVGTIEARELMDLGASGRSRAQFPETS